MVVDVVVEVLVVGDCVPPPLLTSSSLLWQEIMVVSKTKNVKRYFGVSGTIFLIGAGIGFFAIYFDIKGLAYISIACCGISLLVNKDGNINW